MKLESQTNGLLFRTGNSHDKNPVQAVTALKKCKKINIVSTAHFVLNGLHLY